MVGIELELAINLICDSVESISDIEEVLIPDMSDPNKMMTPDEIAALIANL